MSDIEEQRKYYERMMDEVGAGYRSRIVELQDENAHLRESVQNAEYEESVAWDRVRSAERRNDMLRELVRELSTFADYACDVTPSCDRCPMCEGTVTCDLVDIHSRERVLGVSE